MNCIAGRGSDILAKKVRKYVFVQYDYFYGIVQEQ